MAHITGFDLPNIDALLAIDGDINSGNRLEQGEFTDEINAQTLPGRTDETVLSGRLPSRSPEPRVSSADQLPL